MASPSNPRNRLGHHNIWAVLSIEVPKLFDVPALWEKLEKLTVTKRQVFYMSYVLDDLWWLLFIYIYIKMYIYMYSWLTCASFFGRSLGLSFPGSIIKSFITHLRWNHLSSMVKSNSAKSPSATSASTDLSGSPTSGEGPTQTEVQRWTADSKEIPCS